MRLLGALLLLFCIQSYAILHIDFSSTKVNKMNDLYWVKLNNRIVITAKEISCKVHYLDKTNNYRERDINPKWFELLKNCFYAQQQKEEKRKA